MSKFCPTVVVATGFSLDSVISPFVHGFSRTIRQDWCRTTLAPGWAQGGLNPAHVPCVVKILEICFTMNTHGSPCGNFQSQCVSID